MTIPTKNHGNLNLIKVFGRISLTKTKSHCTSYIKIHTRKAQNQYQMYHCLMHSLTDKGRSIIISEISKYSINELKCEPLLFINHRIKARTDTKDTLSHIRDKLSSQYTHTCTIVSNIIKLKGYVAQTRLNLKSRGGITHDLLTNLWKSYACVSDQDFILYIQKNRESYNEGPL